MTKISFTDEHLKIILRALEVYSRLRSGQIKIAMEEAYPEYMLTWDEADSIEKFVRKIIFPETPVLKNDGHGGFYDQYGNSYDEEGRRDSEESWEEKCRKKRPELEGSNSYFGVGHDHMIENGGTLSYEIFSTIRQFLALRDNDGYHGFGVNFYDPLNLTGKPFPEIEGFEREKQFVVKGRAIVSKLEKLQESKKWNEFWDEIGKYLKNKHPELEGYDKARAELVGNHFIIRVEGARKKVKN